MHQEINLVLASASVRRKDLLTLMALAFETRPGTFEEPKKGAQSTQEYVFALAAAKAEHSEAHPGELLLSADTIVELDGELLGKPAGDKQAAETLEALRGRTHGVYTALQLRDVSSGVSLQTICHTKVHMREWTPQEQEDYIYNGSYHDKAGGYAIQDEHFHPVERIEGCYANVMGLPLCHLYGLFVALNLPLPADLPAACQGFTRSKCDVFSAILENPEWRKLKG